MLECQKTLDDENINASVPRDTLLYNNISECQQTLSWNFLTMASLEITVKPKSGPSNLFASGNIRILSISYDIRFTLNTRATLSHSMRAETSSPSRLSTERSAIWEWPLILFSATARCFILFLANTARCSIIQGQPARIYRRLESDKARLQRHSVSGLCPGWCVYVQSSATNQWWLIKRSVLLGELSELWYSIDAGGDNKRYTFEFDNECTQRMWGQLGVTIQHVRVGDEMMQTVHTRSQKEKKRRHMSNTSVTTR